jgi:uncharacterized protein involved in exopolysaccharide biosynthesis
MGSSPNSTPIQPSPILRRRPETTRTAAGRKLLNLPDPEPAAARDQSISYAKKNYTVRTSGHTRIIEITVHSMSPQIATDFTNTLTSVFIDQNLEARLETSKHTNVWLGRQLDDMLVGLERSEDRLQGYARQAGLLFTGELQKNSVSEENCFAPAGPLRPPDRPHLQTIALGNGQYKPRRSSPRRVE